MSIFERTIEFLNGTSLEYQLDVAKRKNMYLCIKNSRLVVKVPMGYSEPYMESFLISKQDWIMKSLSKSRDEIPKLSQYSDGEKFQFMGKLYTLKYSYPECFEDLHFQADILVVSLQKGAEDKNAIKLRTDKFLQQVFMEELKESLDRITKQMSLCPKKVTVKDMSASWGRCSSTGNISISNQLREHSKECMDYVVTHELSHLVYMNHSGEFWKLVDKYCVDRKRIRRELNYGNE